eukprot:scaffold602206_cov37-Prasinocladus_malaysianus.AAC.1
MMRCDPVCKWMMRDIKESCLARSDPSGLLACIQCLARMMSSGHMNIGRKEIVLAWAWKKDGVDAIVGLNDEQCSKLRKDEWADWQRYV